MNQQDKFQQLKITQAKFIDGKLVMNLLKRDYCLVFDVQNQTFNNQQFYLHPELRDVDYNIYSGVIPAINPENDLLLLTHNFVNEIIGKRA